MSLFIGNSRGRMLRRVGTAALCAFAGLLIGGLVADASAQPRPGTLDASFGTAGTVARTFNDGGNNQMWSMALAPDGKIVAAGACSVTNGFSFCIARYLPNGQLDPSFNGNGKLIDPIGSGLSHGRAVGVQTDGRIVVAGFCTVDTNFQLCMRRYLSNGAPDLAFNANVPTLPFASSFTQTYGNHLLIQPDGNILVVGDCFDPLGGGRFHACAARFQSDGKPDPSFGGDGRTALDFGYNVFARRVALDGNGRILVTGRCDTVPGFYAGCVIRLLPNGGQDDSFGGGGMFGGVSSGFGKGDGAWAALAQPDEKLLFVGHEFNPADSPLVGTRLVRTDANARSLDSRVLPPGTPPLGTLTDVGFIVDRVTNYDLTIFNTLIDPDGKFVTAGFCKDIATSKSSACVLRYNGDGTRDTSFSQFVDNGLARFDIGAGDAPVSHLLRQRDGKYLIGGSCVPSANVFDFCLARLEGGPFGYRNCKLDLDGDGRVLGPTDSLLLTRIARGVTGSALLNGVQFAPNATRTNWPAMRDYLTNQCEMKLAP
jgi:uncharacterized delta-60 repeat protein